MKTMLKFNPCHRVCPVIGRAGASPPSRTTGRSMYIRASVDALSRDGTDMRGDAQNS